MRLKVFYLLCVVLSLAFVNGQIASGYTAANDLDQTTSTFAEPTFAVPSSNTATPTNDSGEEPAGENTSALGTLGINPKLLVAQLLNFAILLFILARWVIKPISQNLEKRRQHISQSLLDASLIAKEKAALELWKETETRKSKEQIAAALATASSQAEEILATARLQSQSEKQKMLQDSAKQLEAQKQKALTSLETEIVDLVVTTAEKVAEVKLDQAKDQALINTALKEWQAQHHNSAAI